MTELDETEKKLVADGFVRRTDTPLGVPLWSIPTERAHKIFTKPNKAKPRETDGGK